MSTKLVLPDCERSLVEPLKMLPFILLKQRTVPLNKFIIIKLVPLKSEINNIRDLRLEYDSIVWYSIV